VAAAGMILVAYIININTCKDADNALKKVATRRKANFYFTLTQYDWDSWFPVERSGRGRRPATLNQATRMARFDMNIAGICFESPHEAVR
jgi:hypothetical protein